jgi:hypothetical protein
MGEHIKYNTMSEVYEALNKIDESEYGSNSTSAYKKGQSLIIVYAPNHRYSEVVKVLERCNCRVTHEIERDNDTVMRICIGSDNDESIYANSYEKRRGQPIGKGAEQLFDEMRRDD